MPRITIAPPCQRCGRIFVDGQGEVCAACLRGQRANSRTTKVRALICDCGRRAVTVIWVRVGEGGVYPERMALCARCLKLEKDLYA